MEWKISDNYRSREASEIFHIDKSAENPHFDGFLLHTIKTMDKVVRYGGNNQVDFFEHPTVIQCGDVRTINIYASDSIKEKKQIFATERGYGEFKGQWEFPGGKIEEGETLQQALVREIREELEASIRVGDLIDTIEYDYPTFHLSMDCFWAEIISGKIVLKEAESANWLIRDELDSIQWLPADESLIEKIGAALQFA